MEAERESKRRETDLKEQFAIDRAQLGEIAEAAARAREKQLTAVLAENQAVSRRTELGRVGGVRRRSSQEPRNQRGRLLSEAYGRVVHVELIFHEIL